MGAVARSNAITEQVLSAGEVGGRQATGPVGSPAPPSMVGSSWHVGEEAVPLRSLAPLPALG